MPKLPERMARIGHQFLTPFLKVYSSRLLLKVGKQNDSESTFSNSIAGPESLGCKNTWPGWDIHSR